MLQKQPDRYIFLYAFPNKISPKLNICSKAIYVVSVKVWVHSLKDFFFIESIKLFFFKQQCFSLHISLCSVMEQFNCLHIINSDWFYPWWLPLLQVIFQCSRINLHLSFINYLITFLIVTIITKNQMNFRWCYD